jgi:hypothetical protein
VFVGEHQRALPARARRVFLLRTRGEPIDVCGERTGEAEALTRRVGIAAIERCTVDGTGEQERTRSVAQLGCRDRELDVCAPGLFRPAATAFDNIR